MAICDAPKILGQCSEQVRQIKIGDQRFVNFEQQAQTVTLGLEFVLKCYSLLFGPIEIFDIRIRPIPSDAGVPLPHQLLQKQGCSLREP